MRIDKRLFEETSGGDQQPPWDPDNPPFWWNPNTPIPPDYPPYPQDTDGDGEISISEWLAWVEGSGHAWSEGDTPFPPWVNPFGLPSHAPYNPWWILPPNNPETHPLYYLFLYYQEYYQDYETIIAAIIEQLRNAGIGSYLLSLIGDGLQSILDLIFGSEGDPFGNFLAILAFLYNPHLPSSLARRSRKIFGLLEKLADLLGIDADTLLQLIREGMLEAIPGLNYILNLLLGTPIDVAAGGKYITRRGNLGDEDPENPDLNGDGVPDDGEWIFIEQPPGSGLGVFYWIPAGGGIGAGPIGGPNNPLGAKQFPDVMPHRPKPIITPLPDLPDEVPTDPSQIEGEVQPLNQVPSAVDPQGFPEFVPPDATGPNIIDPRLLYRDKTGDAPGDGGLQGINPEDFPEWAGGTITLENFEEFIEYLLGSGFVSERADHPDNLSIEEIYAAIQALLALGFPGTHFFITNMIMFLYYIGGPEGFSGTVYEDSEGVKTIGYGFTQDAEGLQEALNYINETYGTNYTIAGLFDGSQTLTRAHAGIILALISTSYYNMVVEGMNEAGFHTQTRGLEMIFQIIFSLVYQMGAGFFDKFPNMIQALVEGRFMDAWKQLIYKRGTKGSGTTDWYNQTGPNSPRFQMIYQIFYWLFVFYGITPDGPGVGQKPPIPGGEQVVRPDFSPLGEPNTPIDPVYAGGIVESFVKYNQERINRGLR
jgi:GH24 family phage-related lysozyme (muramidase)